MKKVTEYAYAKINLALDVLRKRPDGYHDVRMIMQTIRLFDKLTLEPAPGQEIMLQTNLAFLPVNDNNLVCKAIRLFRETYGISSGIRAKLEKRIPVAAGLAGGSSDAAAALRAMNRLFDINASIEELQKLGVQIGADVPYCLLGKTALSEGIGEILTPLPDAPSCSCLVVKPGFHLSTKYVYEHLNLADNNSHPDIDAMLAAIRASDFSALCSSVGNILETVSVNLHPEISEIKQRMLSLGAKCSLMSGSGPSVFGLFENEQVAESAYRDFKQGPYARQTFLAPFI